MRCFALLITFEFIFLAGFGQPDDNRLALKLFQLVPTTPIEVGFSNNIDVNTSGGHLQGVQLVERSNSRFAIMTGSSDSYAYYSVVKLGLKNEVVSVNHLMYKPFKHAGGFQVYKNYLAVGIEDNLAKDKSCVCIYDISLPERPSLNPLAMIKREGKPMRSTAGCVGITNYKGKIVLAVGDWDSRNLDFYSVSADSVSGNNFRKFYSIDTKTISRSGWSDQFWRSYQNINLFTLGNKLYLIGFCRDEKKVDVADLFKLADNKSGGFDLIKLASRTFNCSRESSFMAGSGAFLNDKNELEIISCQYNIDKYSYLNLFKK